MNYETIGTRTIGQLIGIYKNSAERCNEIVEILEDLQEAYDSLRHAKDDVRLANNDGDEPSEIEAYEKKVSNREKRLMDIFSQNINGLQARASNLAGDTFDGAEIINK